MEVQCSVKCQVQFLRCFDVYVSVVELRAIQPYTKTNVNKYKGSNVPFNCSTVWGKQTHKIFLSPLPPIIPKQRLLLWQNEMAESDRISLCLSSMITRQNKKQYRIRQYDNSNVQLYVYRKLESVHTSEKRFKLFALFPQSRPEADMCIAHISCVRALNLIWVFIMIWH